MTVHDHEAHADAALRDWFAELEADVPPDFADRVVARIDREDAVAMHPMTARRPHRRSPGRWGVLAAATMAAAALAVLVGGGLRRSTDDTTGASPATAIADEAALASLRDEALATLQTRCTPCHEGTHPEAVAAAIEVFDVDDPRWYAGMTERELDLAVRTIGDDARDRFGAFVATELAMRRQLGT